MRQLCVYFVYSVYQFMHYLYRVSKAMGNSAFFALTYNFFPFCPQSSHRVQRFVVKRNSFSSREQKTKVFNRPKTVWHRRVWRKSGRKTSQSTLNTIASAIAYRICANKNVKCCCCLNQLFCCSQCFCYCNCYFPLFWLGFSVVEE